MSSVPPNSDSVDVAVIVVGGGHAGLEAAAAAARLGASVILVTMDPAAIGRLSCNPAIGGIGKGHLVREIDALGGLMARLADSTGIQFRLLNTSRGPAVRGPRAQVDRRLYPLAAQTLLAELPIEVVADEVADLMVATGSDGRRTCLGVRLRQAGELRARSTVLTTGTFLAATLHSGRETTTGGRRGERAATDLSASLRDLGLPLARFKTGTPPRILASSVDWTGTEVLSGDPKPTFFSAATRSVHLPQVDCHVVRTNEAAHDVIREGLTESPLLDGRITGRGPRYCPSFEEKVVRFADRDSHVLILEPEALDSPELYVNGASTSLPSGHQERFLRAIPALRSVEVTQWGHAVEYDYLPPSEVTKALELQSMRGLYLAGQVLGTTGYEEAAALGLLAGVNSALAARSEPPFILGREEAYAGVMVDDLVVRGIDEPYRMFTSRAENRLLLGIDTADLRLAERAARIGLVPRSAADAAKARAGQLEAAGLLLAATPVPGGLTAADLARRPDTTVGTITTLLAPRSLEALAGDSREATELVRQAMDGLRYATYVHRQQEELASLSRRRHRALPSSLDLTGLSGLSAEVRERLLRFRPTTLDAAARIPGITPAALQVLDALASRHATEASTPPVVPRGTPPARQDS